MPVLAVLCLLTVGCGEESIAFDQIVIGGFSTCAPAPEEPTLTVFSVGGWELDEETTLSEVSIDQRSSTGFDGDASFAVVSADDFAGGIGIEYDGSLELAMPPAPVQGPGTFWFVFVVELQPDEDHLVTFEDLKFEMNGEKFSSADTYELEISQTGCS